MEIRPPVFAHQGWYPAERKSCQDAIEAYTATFPGGVARPLAGIVPHAGWVYSGEVAAWTFAALADARPEVVFVFGGHLRRRDRPVCMTTGAWGTPLGPLPVAARIAARLPEAFPCDVETPGAFRPENTLELQMPLVRAAWPDAEVVAIQVPPAPEAEAIGRWAARVAAEEGVRAVAIGSTDLTHYGPDYGFVPRGLGEEAHRWSKVENDRPFLDHLARLETPEALDHALANHSACCPGAATAAVAFARERGAVQGDLVVHRTSHEVRGRGAPRTWVGYASMAF